MSEETASSVTDETTADPDIWVLALEDADDRGFLFRSAEVRYERAAISSSVLRDRLGHWIDSMQIVVGGIPEHLGDFSVDSVSLSVEISAKGKISLVGTGGELGAAGGVSITLKRHPPPERDATTKS